MNEIVNKFLLTGDSFMPELRLRQQEFAYSACAPLIKHRQKIKKFKEKDDLRLDRTQCIPKKLETNAFAILIPFEKIFPESI